MLPLVRYDTSVRSRIFLPPMLLREAIISEASLTSIGQAAGIEPIASQVFHLGHSERPRKRLRTIALTTELRLTWSGRRDSNSRLSAWKAEALPTELLPRLGWIRDLLPTETDSLNQ